MHLFGSAVTERFDAARSDVDLLVTQLPMPPLTQGETFLNLWAELETLLQRRVDLLTPDSLQNPFLKVEIEQTKQLVYDAARTEIPV
jgi:predicted nucleotidyltransferase